MLSAALSATVEVPTEGSVADFVRLEDELAAQQVLAQSVFALAWR